MKSGRGRRASILGACLLVPGLFALAACSPNPSGEPADAATVTTASPDAGLEVPAEPADTTLAPSSDQSTTIVKVPLTRDLNKGDSGEDVLRLQQRLKDLAFDPGKLDGIYGDNTAESVWAYKSLIMGERWDKDLTSKVTAEVWDRMQDPLGWTPKKTGETPRHLEVFLPEQAAVLVSDGQIRLITHVSTGNGKHWCNVRRPLPDASGTTAASAATATATAATPTTVATQKYCGDSITPAGSYRFWAKRTGTYSGYYGDLWNPTFFNGGIAVHGFDSVPYYPASHGCVRIPNHIADYFQSLVRINDQVFVFDGVNDPEKLGAVPAPFDQIDPDSTSTTSAPSTTTTVKPTTTTAKATTTAPPTTVKPATTVAPVTTAPAPAPTPPTATTTAPGTSPPAVATTASG